MQKSLTQQDKSKLRKKLGFIGIFTIGAVVIFGFIFSFVLKDVTLGSDGFSYIPFVMFGLFGLFFAGIIIYLARTVILDIRLGMKDCYEGIVDDKRLDIRQSSSTSTGARGSSSRSSTTKRNYFITVDGTEHSVEFSMYNAVSVGDSIYFEVAPKSKTVLHHKILEEAVEESKQIQTYAKGSYPTSKIRKAPLTRRDEDSLRSFYNQKIRKRLIIIAFLALPIGGLIFNGLGGLLVFLFPLPIIFIYQLYKLLRFHLNYKKAINSGKKNLVTTQVADKLFTTISRNGSKQQNRTLKTTYGHVRVSEMMYEKVNSGDEIIIHEALHLKSILGISVDDVYYPF
ncbi:hypothetical protein [Kordia jejudonensis]|uniref:hypothetical protein n=1 Tax=Kordia jejudonensis TaxID=1348245 RepID=UPI0006293FDF|nr:hypothetical protein [Kordia jejudonensis]